MRHKRRCRNCPDTPQPKKVPTDMPMLAADGARLWHQALYSCNTLVEMMSRYATLGVPGNPSSRLQKLIGRMQEIVKTCEERHHASDRPVE